MSIEAAVFSRITSDPAIAALIGTRLYPDRAPDAALKPYAIYQRISTVRNLTHDNADTPITVRMAVDCYAETRQQSREIADAVTNTMHGKTWSTGTIAVQLAALDNDAADYLEGVRLHRSSVDFLITYGVTA